MTTAELLTQRGFDLGFEEGFRRGFKEGLEKALRRQLRARFGQLDETLLARLSAASEPQLERYLDRVLTAQSPEEVLAD